MYVASDGGAKVCVIMCGLPARGKSFMSNKIVRYLTWQSIRSKAFNVGVYRRDLCSHPSADFFDPDNVQGQETRRKAAENAIEDTIKWFQEPGNVVAVYDGTNSTRERRKWLQKEFEANGIRPIFVETICNDRNIIMQNVMDVKTSSPDYEGQDPQEAAEDFMKRIAKYEQTYEPITSGESLTYLKIYDIGEHVVVNALQSYLESRIVYYLMNLHIRPRRLWLSRHGESEYNLSGKLGGDSSISERGDLYAHKLPEIVSKVLGDSNLENHPLTVWTSTLKRTQQTARFLPYPKIAWKALDELDAGVCDGLTYEDIQRMHPEDFKARDENKYQYRYRCGESYADVVTRLDPIIMELERQENILIVTHQAVLRCIYAYYMNVPQERSPWMEVPLHTLICLEPHAYGTKETRIAANIPAVNTFRAKGEAPGSLV